MADYRFPFGTYKDNMDRFLAQFKEKETFKVRLEPTDYFVRCTKETFYKMLNKYMPLWFLTSCQRFKKVDDCYEPVFCRIQQAAWDAALKEYFIDKSEFCAKCGSE